MTHRHPPGHSHEHAHPAHGSHGHDHAVIDWQPPPPLAEKCGAGQTLFLDTFSGIAGDMLVAALLDLGVPWESMQRALLALPLTGYHVHVAGAQRSGIVAARFEVHTEGAQPERSYTTIRSMLERAELDEATRNIAQQAFRVLAEAEAEVHRTSVDKLHFHEVGAVDSIVDVVAAAAGFAYVGARVLCSPLPMGRGFTNAQHGKLPLPAPATVRCLRGVPIYDAGIDAELVTPTGACLVVAASREFVRWPTMRPERTGWGAGARELADRPNLLRVVLGSGQATANFPRSELVVVETNLDDASAELAAHAMERALASGALDAWTSPVTMKKSRPGLVLSVLGRREDVDALSANLLRETTSIGVRSYDVSRIERPRRNVDVETPFGLISVKIADGDGLPANIAPEFESCRAAALAHGVSVKEVMAVAMEAARGA